MFFQDLYHWLSYYVTKFRPNVKTEGSQFLSDAYQHVFDHMYFDLWFDKEIRKFCGIDVFEKPFVPGEFSIFEKGKFQVLLGRLEDLDNNWQNLEVFCGAELLRRDANRGELKWYQKIYSEFKVQVDESGVDDFMYDTRTASYFGYQRTINREQAKGSH